MPYPTARDIRNALNDDGRRKRYIHTRWADGFQRHHKRGSGHIPRPTREARNRFSGWMLKRQLRRTA